MKSVCATATVALASLLGLWGLAGVSGCRPAPPPVATAPSAPVAPGTVEAPREIQIEVGDAMKFSLTRIEATAGETLRVLLVNTGSASKETMGHNWVLLKAGVDATSYANAAIAAKASDYLPAARADDVIAHTRVIGGRERDAVVFAVPTTPGSYVFLCSFPAHLQLGMKGVVVVKQEP